MTPATRRAGARVVRVPFYGMDLPIAFVILLVVVAVVAVGVSAYWRQRAGRKRGDPRHCAEELSRYQPRMACDRKIDIVEHPGVPWLSVVLGYGPMLPIMAAAVIAWTSGGVARGEAILIGVIYSASILAFLVGVRRGVSFRTEGGPALAQLVTMAGLWMLAFLALVLLAHGLAATALGALAVGYATIMVLDPIAARDGQAPLFFAQLRPTQMSLAVAGLLALLANAWLR